ncbi:hypothetical protein PANT111_440013 [Pantoea brenneri]|uniref:Uncharacterized protein n=1 Tax=Pantoea brenneri TaxID=472694 RepID=A0AAX3JBC1_9GAMM|nr:hypothetical protein PANT111_440013 [Pantoea brenneri]
MILALIWRDKSKTFSIQGST